MKSMQTATMNWLDTLNQYPTELIRKVYLESDNHSICEITPVIEGNKVWSDKLQEICNVLKVYRFDELVTLEIENTSVIETVHLNGVTLINESFLPMWGTLWGFKDTRWISLKDNKVRMAELGFRLYETDELGIIFGINGAGYNFIERHWQPLYIEKELRHNSTKNKNLDDVLMKYFNTTGNNGYSALISLLYDLNDIGVLNNVNEVVDFLDEQREYKGGVL